VYGDWASSLSYSGRYAILAALTTSGIAPQTTMGHWFGNESRINGKKC